MIRLRYAWAMNTEERFWSKVDKSGGPDACWIWTAGRKQGGYGRFRVGRKMVLAHRFSYALKNGPIPEGLRGCHTCDNPPCCNPAHIWVGTAQDNTQDMIKKGRRGGNAKLSWDVAAEIRLLYGGGNAGITQKDLGKRFGITRSQVSNIITETHWKSKPINFTKTLLKVTGKQDDN